MDSPNGALSFAWARIPLFLCKGENTTFLAKRKSHLSEHLFLPLTNREKSLTEGIS